MNQCRNQKSYQLAPLSADPVFRKPLNININVVEQPFVDHNIPFPIVSAKLYTIPPIFIEVPFCNS